MKPLHSPLNDPTFDRPISVLKQPVSKVALMLACTLAIVGCQGKNDKQQKLETEVAQEKEASGPGDEYKLHVGDVLRMEIYGEPDLAKQSEVDPEGKVTFILIGQVKAEGRSLPEMQRILTARYAEDYLVAPKINLILLQRADGNPVANHKLAMARLHLQEITRRYHHKHPKYLHALKKLQDLESRE